MPYFISGIYAKFQKSMSIFAKDVPKMSKLSSLPKKFRRRLLFDLDIQLEIFLLSLIEIYVHIITSCV